MFNTIENKSHVTQDAANLCAVHFAKSLKKYPDQFQAVKERIMFLFPGANMDEALSCCWEYFNDQK